MNQTHVASAHERITSLQARLNDINALLIEVLGISKGYDSSARTNLKIAIRAISAVQTDLQSVCDDHLTEPANASIASLAASDAVITGQ
jgi:hypothetical protein